MSHEHKYSLPSGVRLRQYIIVRLLGHGGFGLTYLADDTKLSRKVAIKELFPMDFAVRERDGMTVVAKSPRDRTHLEWARQRFVEEGQTLASLHHPSILPIYEIFEEHGTAYLVTAFIEGVNLEDWLRKVRRPAEKELRSIAVCLLEALEIVHERGYLHRDVKPENILMDRRDRRPILIDFGNARVAAGLKTANMTAVLTKGYAPVEQYQSKARQGPFSDIYALGAVLYRAIKGVAPEDSLDRWDQDKVEPLCQRPPPGYSLEFLSTIDKALRVRREDRWQNCEEWKTALGVSDPIFPRPLGPLPKLSRIVLIAVALGLLVIAGIGFEPWIKDHLLTSDSSDTVDDGRNSPAPAGPTPPVVIATPNPTPAPAPPDPTPLPLAPVTPDLATLDHPYVNSLGMKFVPVPVRNGRKLLFCIHETRKRDYGEYAAGHPSLDPSWQAPMDKGVPVSEFPDHPVVNVSMDDAEAFCVWLTESERASGRIDGRHVFRLPTDDEWSCAVGLGTMENPGDSPMNKSRAYKDVFPWGRSFNPFGNPVGNYADEAMKKRYGEGLAQDSYIKGYNDGYATTAPVMQFPANTFGIYDLGGNVMEWCAGNYDSRKNPPQTRRGGSWKTDGTYGFERPFEKLSSSSRNAGYKDSRETDVGFRCVLVLPDR
jgi:serine/threonine protein kinase/formylglycine-generating enzyme required for sulfatase activity